MKRLNGWQRLWVVGTVALGIFTIGFGVTNLETKSMLLDKYDFQIKEYRSQIEELKFRKDSPKPTRIIDEILFEDNPTTKTEELKSKIVDLNNKLETELKTVTSTLFKNILVLFGLWLGTSVFTYMSGMIINWIYNGFRPSRGI